MSTTACKPAVKRMGSPTYERVPKPHKWRPEPTLAMAYPERLRRASMPKPDIGGQSPPPPPRHHENMQRPRLLLTILRQVWDRRDDDDGSGNTDGYHNHNDDDVTDDCNDDGDDNDDTGNDDAARMAGACRAPLRFVAACGRGRVGSCKIHRHNPMCADVDDDKGNGRAKPAL